MYVKTTILADRNFIKLCFKMIGIKRFSVGKEINNFDKVKSSLGSEECTVGQEMTHTNENKSAEPLTLTNMQNGNGNESCIYVV